MSQVSYVYQFDDITESASCVELWRPDRTGSRRVQLHIDDNELLRRATSRLTSVMADAVDLATAVQVADRLTLHCAADRLTIHIILPVRHPEIMGNDPVADLLAEILLWYTGRRWTFDFRPRRSEGRPADLQIHLPHTGEPPATEVALWSGGLDATAGLVARTLSDPDAMASVTLCGTGANVMVQHVQRTVAARLDPLVASRLKLIQLPVRLRGLGEMPTNARSRARGFVFLLLGAACAVAEGQARLAIYENGVGAINLPLLPSSVGLAHARSVHPRSLIQMGKLVSALLGTPFRYENPFLFWTKAQMCAALEATRATDIVPLTVTCDRHHRQRPFQCGYCSSCLLRRQALAAAGLPDHTAYRLFATDRPGRPSDASHLLAMLDQVAVLDACLRQPDPWTALAMRYLPLLEVADWLERGGHGADGVRQELVALYRRYVHEWQAARESVRRGLLPPTNPLPTAA